jgi:hypothetical protein
MRLEAKGFGAMGAAAKGRLWSRGLFLAEAEIEGGVEPIGRWRRAGAGTGNEAGAELTEEMGLAAMAA